MIHKKFEELSKTIWTNIELSNRYRTIYGEETITDSILLELAKLESINIRIVQTPKFIEKDQGTDWEWFVGSKRYGWIRFALQAKKLSLKTHVYDQLNHKVGKLLNARLQIDLLKDFAKANNAVPLYTFYNNYPDGLESSHWHCPEPFERELMGWTFTPLTNIEQASS